MQMYSNTFPESALDGQYRREAESLARKESDVLRGTEQDVYM